MPKAGSFFKQENHSKDIQVRLAWGHICQQSGLWGRITAEFKAVLCSEWNFTHAKECKRSSWVYSPLSWEAFNSFLTASFSHSQQIITQDFARNQVPSQPSTSTFQTSPSALSSTPVRTKPSSRYSPESQSQTVLHPRPGPRVSPENLVDKSRGRYSFVLYQT